MQLIADIPWLLPAMALCLSCLGFSVLLARIIRQKSINQDEVRGAFAAAGGALLQVDYRNGRILEEQYLSDLLKLKRPVKHLEDLNAVLDTESMKVLQSLQKSAQKGEALKQVMLRANHHQFILCYPALHQGTKRHRQHTMQLILMDATEHQRSYLMMQSESDAMKEEVQRYAAIMNNLRMLCWIRDKAGVIQYCNLSYTQAVEDISSDEDIGVPELHPEMRALSLEAIQSDEEQEKHMHVVIDGQRRLYHFREVYAPEMDATIGYAYDNTELEQAEDEIKSYQTAQEDLLESATSAVAVFGADTRLRFFNQAYVRMWDYDERWLEDSPTFGEIIELLREKRMLTEQANVQAYKQHQLRLFTDILEPQEEIHYTPDGRTIRSVAIPYALGGIIVSYEDVTDRLALERSYNTLIAVQRETLDNLHEGVVVYGEDGRLQLKNPEFAKIWGLSDALVAERTHMNDIMEKVCELLPDKHWETYKKDFLKDVQSRALLASRWERTDGRMVDWTMVPLPDGATLLTYTDVTDSTLVERSLREKNEALQAADRLKTEFLANVSYELRSPLTSISGFSEMLRQNYFGELNDQQREYVEGIHDSAQHLSQLINDILDLASIEAGYLALQENTFDIYEMLRGIRSLLLERAKEFDLKIKIECDSDIGEMQGDERRIRQVMFHLLSNAVKYSKRGTIILGAEREDKHIHLWVKDEGIGIAPEEQELIFDKFYRGKAGSNTAGTGLGLSMVHNFMTLHGGKVNLESELNKGTTMHCRVPLNPFKETELIETNH